MVGLTGGADRVVGPLRPGYSPLQSEVLSMLRHHAPLLASLFLLGGCGLWPTSPGWDGSSPEPVWIQDDAPTPDAAQLAEEAAAAAAARKNVEACVEWVQAFNGLECLPESARLDPELTCPPTLNLACDQAAFWRCMVENTRCEGAIPAQPTPSECPSPC